MAEFRSGVVSILGFPNAGKSTLVNRIIGQKITIVSHKLQTTRTKILGCYHGADTQVVLVDTPGISRSAHLLSSYMSAEIMDAICRANVIAFVIDGRLPLGVVCSCVEKLKDFDLNALPVVLVINKVDGMATDRLFPLISKLMSIYNFDEVVPISAKTGYGITKLLGVLDKYFVENLKYFKKGVVTDQSRAKMISEVIREKALKFLNQELPHGVAVEIDNISFNKEKRVCFVSATLHCDRQNHKKMIIGKNGNKLKAIGVAARCDIEKMFNYKVFLELYVKVSLDWRNKESFIKEFV